MARYIDADLLKDEYYELYHHGTMAVKSVLSVFVNLLDNQPTSDVAEVKHGEWVYKKLNDGYFHDSFCCSLCGREALFDRFCMGELSDFCPNCGAKMDGGKHDN